MMKKTFIYKETIDCTIKADFYPASTEILPVLIYIHGGGLIWGTREEIKAEQIAMYHEAGYHVCSIDYRLGPETKLPKILKDVEDAVKWVKTKGVEKFPIDNSRIAVIGSSAGAYLALASGTFHAKPNAIISFYGYGDILADWYQKPSLHFLKMPKAPDSLAKQLIGSTSISEGPIESRYGIYLNYRQQGSWTTNITGLDPKKDKERIKAYCPINNIKDDFPPTLLIHGDKDKDVPRQASDIMSEALTKKGVKNKLLHIPDAEHIFDQNMNDPKAIQAIKDVITFLKEHL